MKLRDYQKELSEKGALLLQKYKLLYLVFEMRVGKTPVSLEICNKLFKSKYGRVLFITKKKAIKDIENFYLRLGYEKKFYLDVTNYESLHKLSKVDYDIIICDEAQTLGSYPKPNKRTKQLKEICVNKRIIFLSGTPTPESYSQIYHQLWISSYTPFKEMNFYKWAKAGFVNIITKRISGTYINDYSNASESKILPYIRPFILSYTQEQAGFEIQELNDEIFYVKMNPYITRVCISLIKDRIFEINSRVHIVANTAAKLQQKIHQLHSGTIIAEEDGDRVYYIIDRTKALYIFNKYYGKQKIAIYYLYQSEGDVLKDIFKTVWTDEPEVFNTSDKDIVFISQFQSGSKGINISKAEVIIFYNIHFSSELYQQVRQRASEKTKKLKTKLHWIFTKGGIEEKIYKRVLNKQSYTITYFKEDYL